MKKQYKLRVLQLIADKVCPQDLSTYNFNKQVEYIYTNHFYSTDPISLLFLGWGLND